MTAGENDTRTSPDGVPGPAEVAAALLERLVDVSTLPDVLTVFSELAAEVVPGCEAAAVAVLREGAPAEVASVHEGVRHVDET